MHWLWTQEKLVNKQTDIRSFLPKAASSAGGAAGGLDQHASKFSASSMKPEVAAALAKARPLGAIWGTERYELTEMRVIQVSLHRGWN